MRPETPGPRVRVLPGDQVVVRYGAIVALLGPPGPGTVALRDALRTAAGAEDPAAAAAAALEGADPPAVALVLAAGASPAVVMRGDLDVRARSAVGELRLNAGAADGVVQQPLLGEFSQVRLGRAEAEPDPWVDLEAGAVLGGGVVIALAEAPVGAAAPVRAGAGRPGGAEPEAGQQAGREAAGDEEAPREAAGDEDAPRETGEEPPTEAVAVVTADWAPPPPEPLPEPAPVSPGRASPAAAGFTSVSLLAPETLAAPPRAPLPVASPVVAEPGTGHPAGEPTEEEAGEVVEGLNCGRGHFNHPHAANCAWCGLGMLQVSHVLVRGPRPPLGVLVVDEQATFTLDADYVVGRRPSLDTSVDGVGVRELVLSDPDRSVSRVHAAIRLEGWDVVVEDRRSGNGTWVIGNAGPPERVPPDRPRVLRPGEHVHVGPHRLTFHSHHLR